MEKKSPRIFRAQIGYLRKTCRFCSMGTIGTENMSSQRWKTLLAKTKMSLSLGWGIIGYVDVSCLDPKQPPGMIKTLKTPINNGTIIILGGAEFCPSTVSLIYPLEALMRTKYFNEVDGSISAKDGDGMVDHKIAINLSLLLLMEEILPAPATKYTAVIVDG